MSYEIIIDGTKLLWSTSFTLTDESEPSETETHTGVIMTPAEIGNWTIGIDRATAHDYLEEQEVYDLMEKSKNEYVTIVATKKTNKGVIRNTCTNCLRTSYDEDVDEKGEITYSAEWKAQNVKKEFLKA